MDCITGPLQRDAPWDMLFADDVVLCGETCDKVERRLENWRKAMEDRGMRVSREKTEYLCLGSQEDQVHMEGSQLKRVEDFKYLGSTVQMDGGMEKEVAKRIQAGWGAWRKVTGIMCDRKVPAAVKGRMYKTMIRPAMLYCMETVAVTKGQERKMEVAEMKILRFSWEKRGLIALKTPSSGGE